LKPHRLPVTLIILDGWGLRSCADGNAVAQARTPVMEDALRRWPSCTLQAAGEAVGLSPGQMGNSNVGHQNLGAGRIVYQDPVRVSRAIEDGSFAENDVIRDLMAAPGDEGSLHLMGLVSDGGVHSKMDHLMALIDMAEDRGALPVFVHAFLDGRDVPPRSAERYLRLLDDRLDGRGAIATVMGRYYAMDRDRRWDRTEAAYAAMVHGEGLRAPDPFSALRAAYERGEDDEFVRPTVLTGHDGSPRAAIRERDACFIFNFRADRVRQLTRALVEGGVRPVIVPYAFPPLEIRNTLGEVVSRHGRKQLRIAETEKYAHVTYFFSGGREEPFEGEDRVLVPSPKVSTYDLKPEMSARELTDAVARRIRSGAYDLIVLNYANLDMVGHTGVMEAAVRAVEAVDSCLGRVLEAVRETGGAAVVTADHGNAEVMMDEDIGQPHTAHTTNPVPFVIVGAPEGIELRCGVLGNVAPTVLDLMGLPVPEEMEQTLIVGGVSTCSEEDG